MKIIFACLLFACLPVSDATKIKADIEKDIKASFARNAHGNMSYETISMSELEPQLVPFFCTSRGSMLADSIYDESEARHNAVFNAIVALQNNITDKALLSDSTSHMKAAEKEYKKALHAYYIREAKQYIMKPDTFYHLEIVFHITSTEPDGTKQHTVDSAGFAINSRMSKYTLEDEFIKKAHLLPSGCNYNGHLMLDHPDKEEWESPPPPPSFH